MIVTLTGKPGSGKSTIGKRLAEALGFKRYYMGGLRRKMAKDRGMTLAEFNRLGESEDFTDREVDKAVTTLGTTEDNFVIESRTAYHFIPHGIHIFLDVEPREGARRIFGHLKDDPDNSRNEDTNLGSVEDVLRSNSERMESDRMRYRKYYHLDVFDPQNFHLVIDTTHLTPDQVFAKIIGFLQEKDSTFGEQHREKNT